jgi:hypothetical protein
LADSPGPPDPDPPPIGSASEFERDVKQAYEAAAAKSPAPASNVVDLAAVRRGESSAGTSEAPPPPNESAASAAEKGHGGKAKGKREKKEIDWGRFTYLLENFTYIYPTDTAWDASKRKVVPLSGMNHMYGTDYVRMWKTNPDRKTIDEEGLVFDPSGACGPDAINLWDGMAVEPAASDDRDVQVMLELLGHLCGRCQDADEVMHWVLRWLALPLQKRGAKMATALVFHGPQGTGKNLFFDVIRAMYGKYGVMVGQTEIEEKYNGWISAKQLVVCNEVVSRQELYSSKNRLKWLVDAPVIPIRTMHTDTRWEANWANLVFLSNENKPLALEKGDRRHQVVYTPTPEDGTLYDRVRAFLAAGGAAKFLDYLLRYPVEDFHEHTKPLMTEAKAELIELGMAAEERFMEDWVGGFLNLPMRVCSAGQLYRAFQRWCVINGERFVPNQAAFTTAAKRWALERTDRDEDTRRKLEPCLTYKVVNLKHDQGGLRKAERCWIPRGAGPLNGVSEGEWAAASVDAFETDLNAFVRPHAETPPSPGSGKKGSSE